MKLLRLAGASLFGLTAVKLAGDAAVRRHERLDLEGASPSGEWLTAGGQRLHVVRRGEGAPLVLLHGLGDSVDAWRLNIPALSRHFRVIAVDLMGHGLSTRTAADLSLTAQAAAVKALLDGLGIERATVAGHSMGGSIAQRLAATWPEMVERLILIASTTDDYMLRAGWASRLMAPFIPAFVTVVLNNRFVRRQHLKLIVANPSHVTTDIGREYAAASRMRGHTRCYQQLMLDRTRDQRIDLTRITAPTLIIWGDRDRLVSIRNGQRLAAAIAGSRLVVVPDAGHLVPEEQPKAVNRLFLEFLGTEATPITRPIATV